MAAMDNFFDKDLIFWHLNLQYQKHICRYSIKNKCGNVRLQYPTQKDFERTLHRNEEKMRIAVCDDKKEDRNQIKSLLEMYHQTFEIKEYDDSTALCTDSSFLQTCKILFLDINMHGMSGLEAARQIKSEYPTIHIILVTAYMNYALDGYKVKASRFLLKDDLDQTFEECMDDILKEIQQEERVVTYDFVEGSAQLRVDDIIYIETNRHKNIFYTQSQTLSIYRKMDDLENELKNMGFVRVHKSFLINMKYIKKISSYRMTLTTGKEISVPKSRYPEVKQQYTLFKGTQ